jgi:type VI secretion system protein ImpL
MGARATTRASTRRVRREFHERAFFRGRRSMKRLLRQPWFWLLLATLVLWAAIWFGLPPLGVESVPVRLGAMLGVAILWAIANLIVRVRAARANTALVDELKKHEEEAAKAEDAARKDAIDEELGNVRERARQALAVLRRARFGGRFFRRWVYELPWYVLIGPPASGKTTAVLRSGLGFPLAEQLGGAPITGVAGTRDCDWWFTDQAVLIDTAGRYTTQDSRAEIDRAVWQGLLRLLRRHRRRQPINGALVVISPVELARMSEEERAAQARAVRLRLADLQRELNLRVPTYLLFSKADLVLGFDEFFDRLGRDERGQVWGATLAADAAREADGGITSALAGFDALVKRLSRPLLRRLQDEPDARRRARVLEFPAQIAALRPIVAEFVETVFKPSRLEPTATLRGLYLVSSTQQGRLLDALLSGAATSLGLPARLLATRPERAPRTPRSFFLTRLLRDVVFAEASIVGVDAMTERRRMALSVLAAIGIAGLAGTLLLGWHDAYSRATAAFDGASGAIERVDRQAASLRAPGEGRLIDVLRTLDTLRDLPEGYAAAHGERDATPSLGLYPATAVAGAANAAYRRGLEQLLLPRLIVFSERAVREAMNDPPWLFQALKLQLMLAGRGPTDVNFVVGWMGFEVDRGRLLLDAQDRARLLAHTAVLADSLPVGGAIDERLVANARARLSPAALAEHGYATLIDLPVATALPRWRLIDQGGAVAARVLLRPSGRSLADGVPGIFTREGFRDVALPSLPRLADTLASDGWVLGDAGGSRRDLKQQLEREILALYLERYARAWDELLADVTIVPFRSPAHAADTLSIIAGPASPVKRVLAGVAAETDLTPPQPAKAAAALPPGVTQGATVAQQAASQAGAEASSVSQLARAAGSLVTPPDLGAPVTARFRWLKEFMTGVDGAPPAYDDIAKRFEELYRAFNRLAFGPRDGSDMAAAAAAVPGESAAVSLASLAGKAETLPVPLGDLLRGVAASGAGVRAGNARTYMAEIWASQILPACKAVERRYPINAGASDEAALDDIVALLGPGGQIDKFFNTHLKPFVDVSTVPWRWQQIETVGLGLGPDQLAPFERAARIREALFAGQPKASLRFELVPVKLDERVETLLIEIDGKLATYQHGPTSPIAFEWPGATPPGKARVSMLPETPPSSAETGGGTNIYPGTWGLLRLLGNATGASFDEPDRSSLTFHVGSRLATLQLRAPATRNPLKLAADLKNFRCPELR